MFVCDPKHQARAKQANEQTSALCSGPGDALKLLMYSCYSWKKSKGKFYKPGVRYVLKERGERV